jgi:hypothetical protein
VEEYLTITEVASRLRLSPKTVRTKMTSGVFQKGVHYFRRRGLGPRFKWSAVVKWLEGEDREHRQEAGNVIPMRRGYNLGEGTEEAA